MYVRGDDMELKKKRLLSAAFIWALDKLSDPCFHDDAKSLAGLTFKKDDKTVGFLTEYDANTENELSAKIIAASSSFPLIYMIFSDYKKADEFKKKAPSNCGILCYHNAYGMGFVYQVIKNLI